MHKNANKCKIHSGQKRPIRTAHLFAYVCMVPVSLPTQHLAHLCYFTERRKMTEEVKKHIDLKD